MRIKRMTIKKMLYNTILGKTIWPTLHNIKNNIKRPLYIKKIKKQLANNKKHIFYCGICESSNMGDMAQTYCTLQWLEKNYPEHDIVMCLTSVLMDSRFDLIGIMKSAIMQDDMIFFQSGYNTHDLGGYEDIMHQLIIKNFPDTVIIMLPQTVYFKSEDRKQQCSRIYNSHKKMLFLARDPISYDYAKEMFPNLIVKLFPDIVTSLIGYKEEEENRKGIYLCRRKDVEQFYKEEEYCQFENVLRNIDENVIVSDTIISASNSTIFRNLEKYVNEMINYFGKFRLIVTDKYHGLIFSLISNTPVIVLKTKDHKVTSGYEWFSKIYPDRVFFAETTNEIYGKSKMVLENPKYSKLSKYFDLEYYQKLKMVIDEWQETL